MIGAMAIHGVLQQALAETTDVVVLGEAVELSPATRGLLAAHPDRVHLLPAADVSLMGVAVGMALAGKRPVVELSGPDALWGALQQLGQEAAHAAAEFPIRVVVRVPFLPGGFDPSELLRGVSGVCVACASGPGECAALLSAALQASGPVVILEPRTALVTAGSAAQPLALGEARVVREGEHATVLALGEQVGQALEAAESLLSEGLSVEVIDLRCLSPLDVSTIGDSVRRTGRTVVAGGGAGVTDAAVSQAFLRLESAPVHASGATAIAAAIRTAVAF